jgi:hypothetical protein
MLNCEVFSGLRNIDNVCNIDWDNFECHKRFMDAPEYKPFLEKLNRIFARPPKLVHFLPTPFPPSILAKAACTEMAMFYQTSDEFLGSVKKFLECLPGVDGYVGNCFGGVMEEIEKEDGSGKGKAVLLCIGWTGLEKHMAFRETEGFKANVPLLRKGRGAVEMVSLLVLNNSIRIDCGS